MRVGTAGWSLPPVYRERFPEEGTYLERYAKRFNAVEINSSFYRSHRPQTYARWAESVPDGFRFAVKAPKDITHTRKLIGVARLFKAFAGEISMLGDRLGPVLVQLPPSLMYSAAAGRFFDMVRAHVDGMVVCEPRHASWFDDKAEAMFQRFKIVRVAADPARHPGAGAPGGYAGAAYWRLHGSPRIYYSSYTARTINSVAKAMQNGAGEPWCIFDNTVLGEATGNALALVQKLTRSGA